MKIQLGTCVLQLGNRPCTLPPLRKFLHLTLNTVGKQVGNYTNCCSGKLEPVSEGLITRVWSRVNQARLFVIEEDRLPKSASSQTAILGVFKDLQTTGAFFNDCFFSGQQNHPPIHHVSCFWNSSSFQKWFALQHGRLLSKKQNFPQRVKMVCRSRGWKEEAQTRQLKIQMRTLSSSPETDLFLFLILWTVNSYENRYVVPLSNFGSQRK